MGHTSTKTSGLPRSPARLSSALFAVFFAYAVYVQINDPDTAVWMTAYGAPCVLALLHAVRLERVIPLQALRVLCLLPILFFLFSITPPDHYSHPFDVSTESGRERTGLGISAAFLVLSILSDAASFEWLTWIAVPLATTALAAAYVVPKYIMKGEDAQGHCRGIGFAPAACSA